MHVFLPRIQYLLSSLLLIAVLFLSAGTAVAAPSPYDHSIWDAFLKKYVASDGNIDYAAAREDSALLDDYLDKIRALDVRTVRGWPREERLALWLNAFHAGLTRLVLKHYPVENVQTVPGFWDLPAVKLGVRTHSLNAIRNDRLMNTFRDEKIHAVMSCAARGCPRMKQEAFTGPRVEGQMFVSTRKIVNHPRAVTVAEKEKKVYLSRLFKWYGHDFLLDFGNSEGHEQFSEIENAVLSFIAYYHEDIEVVSFLSDGNFKIKYFPFDWTLNDTRLPEEDAV